MKVILTAAAAALLFSASAKANVILSDGFSYADGPITTVSTGAWAAHSGTDAGTTALNVTSQQAVVNQGDTHGGGADVNRLFTSGAADGNTDNTTKFYSSFTVNFSALPVSGDSDGSYFAHFKSSALNEFYGRIGANTNGAAAGTLRLAVANENWNVAVTQEFPQDLNLNTTYQVVTRLDLATDQTTLWVNPLNESSTSVTATDAITYLAGTINAYALRQGVSGTGAPGILAVDNLVVGNSFAEVTPEPASLSALALGAVGMIRRRRA